jgi:hydrocephalus-inducing protein
MSQKQTRWVLQPKESQTLYVKFFSTKIGNFKQVLQFEIVGSYKPFNLTANAVCDFPQINTFYKNLYLNYKKVRPTTEPESFLQKTFVISENTFDFGPLLIGKDPEKRDDDEVKSVNGTFFQITNNGKYDL